MPSKRRAPTPESITFGNALRAQRGAMSQEDLALAVGYSQSQVSDWENGTEPFPAQVFALEEALELRPGTLSKILGYRPLDAKSAHSLEEAIASEPSLDQVGREAVRGVYRSVRKPIERATRHRS